MAPFTGEADLQGRPVLRRERLGLLAANDLHFALVCQRPVSDIAEIIARNPSLVDSKDGRGHTPLHLAVMNQSADVVKLLLDNGAPVNAATDVQNTPLHLAYDKPEMATLLVEYGCIIESLNKWQKTPLDWINATINSATGPTGRVRAILEAAEEDFPLMLGRAKQQQLRVEARRKAAAEIDASADARAAAELGAAEAWLTELQGGGGGGGDEEGDEASVSSMAALAAAKGPLFARDLYSAVKQSKSKEVNRARKESDATQVRRFLSGPIGLSLESVARCCQFLPLGTAASLPRVTSSR